SGALLVVVGVLIYSNFLLRLVSYLYSFFYRLGITF
ncbi:hypothetical protein HKBW3S43_01879, partial [Candidatus Hakubella thermalkaliphila]